MANISQITVRLEPRNLPKWAFVVGLYFLGLPVAWFFKTIEVK